MPGTDLHTCCEGACLETQSQPQRVQIGLGEKSDQKRGLCPAESIDRSHYW